MKKPNCETNVRKPVMLTVACVRSVRMRAALYASRKLVSIPPVLFPVRSSASVTVAEAAGEDTERNRVVAVADAG